MAISIATWCDLIDRKEMLFEVQFEIDPLFCLNMCLIINMDIQLFLQSCQDATKSIKVEFTYLDFSFDQGGIERGRFSCNPPPSLLALFNAVTLFGGEGESNNNNCRQTNTLSGIQHEDTNDKQEFVQNEHTNKKWIVVDRNESLNAFPPSIWTSDPPPVLNESDMYCCPRLNG